MVLLEFSMFPLDKGESVSQYVARSVDIIDRSGLAYQTHAMGTVVEGGVRPGARRRSPLLRGNGRRLQSHRVLY